MVLVVAYNYSVRVRLLRADLLVQRVLVTTDPPSWDLQLRSKKCVEMKTESARLFGEKGREKQNTIQEPKLIHALR